MSKNFVRLSGYSTLGNFHSVEFYDHDGAVLLLHSFAFGREGVSLKDRRLKGSELS